jgi:predicted phosphodiesterase
MSTTKKVLTVADLHCSSGLYRLLAAALEAHKPDLVAVLGDFLDATGETEGKLTAEECARALSGLACPEMVFLRGNHEDSGWWQFVEAWQPSGRELNLLEGACFVTGPLVITGFPCLMCGEGGLMADVPADPDAWLPKLLRPHLPAARALWLMHEPPSGTVLSEVHGPVGGRGEWRRAIDRFSPRLVIFGHDHRTPITKKQWHYRINADTYCVNVGQTDSGPLRYAMVTLTFRGDTPSLPEEIVVSAYPELGSFSQRSLSRVPGNVGEDARTATAVERSQAPPDRTDTIP